ncbi:MAG: ribulose-phosphate 3-epimerase [Desulfobacterales bacterium]|nr:ribulose-phosphate 3-epimerase [Desulfobacterales bacterium]
MKLIAPSILSANLIILEQEIKAVEAAGADWIHIDVMDGHFVPNMTYGPVIVNVLRKLTQLPLDVHLMVDNPDVIVPLFVAEGADCISVHIEACTHAHRMLQWIKDQKCQAGIALNPATPLSSIEWVIEMVDYVVVMSVNPGFAGQHFIPNTLEKIRLLRKMILDKGLSTRIQVDGGVNPKTIQSVAQAGADIMVAGSAIFGSSNYAETIHSFRKLMRDNYETI